VVAAGLGRRKLVQRGAGAGEQSAHTAGASQPQPANAWKQNHQDSCLHAGGGQSSNVLAGVVANDRPSTVARALSNVRASPSGVEWSFVLYDGRAAAFDVVRRHAPHRVVVSEGSLRAQRVKTVLWLDLLRTLRPHSRWIWLLDCDISLVGFAWSGFTAALCCAFEAGPPLVAQPLINQSRQSWWPVNRNTWLGSAAPLASLNASAALTPFVEIQAPILDTRFLVWLVEQLRDSGFVTAALRFRSQWAVDLLWCAAAADYVARTGSRRVGCAVIPAAVVDHDAQRDINTRDPADARRGMSLVDWSRLHLRNWTLSEAEVNQLVDPRKRESVLHRVDGRLHGKLMVETLHNLTGAARPVVAHSSLSSVC